MVGMVAAGVFLGAVALAVLGVDAGLALAMLALVATTTYAVHLLLFMNRPSPPQTPGRATARPLHMLTARPLHKFVECPQTGYRILRHERAPTTSLLQPPMAYGYPRRTAGIRLAAPPNTSAMPSAVEEALERRYAEIATSSEERDKNYSAYVSKLTQDGTEQLLKDRASALGLSVNTSTGHISLADDFEFKRPQLCFDLIYCRHGKTTGNTEPRVYQGYVDDDINQLNDIGMAQAETAADELEALGLSPDLILLSPLGRAADTGMAYVNRNAALKKKTETWDELHEMAFGEWDNVMVKDLEAANICHLFYLSENALVQSDTPYIDPNDKAIPSECFVDVLERADKTLRKLNDRMLKLTKRNGPAAPPPLVVIYGHSMHGAAMSIMTANGKAVEGATHLGFDGKYIMPNAQPVFLTRAAPATAAPKSAVGPGSTPETDEKKTADDPAAAAQEGDSTDREEPGSIPEDDNNSSESTSSSSSSPKSPPLLPVDDDTTAFASAVVFGVLGFSVGGPLAAAISALAANYVATTDSVNPDLRGAVRGVSAKGVDAVNVTAMLNSRFNLLTKLQSALVTRYQRLKDAGGPSAKRELERVEAALDSATSRISEVYDEYDVVDKVADSVKMELKASAKLVDAVVNKAVAVDEKYEVVEVVKLAVTRPGEFSDLTKEAVEEATILTKEKLDRNRDNVKDRVTASQDKVAGLYEELLDATAAVKEAAVRLPDDTKAEFDARVRAAQQSFNDTSAALTQVLDDAKEVPGRVVDTVTNVTDDVTTTIKRLPDTMASKREEISSDWDSAVDDVRRVVDPARVTTLQDDVIEGWDSNADVVRNTVNDSLSYVKAMPKESEEAWDRFASDVKGGLDTIKAMPKESEEAWESMVADLRSRYDKSIAAATDTVEAVQRLPEATQEELSERVSRVVETKDKLVALPDDVVSVYQANVNTLTAALNSLQRWPQDTQQALQARAAAVDEAVAAAQARLQQLQGIEPTTTTAPADAITPAAPPAGGRWGRERAGQGRRRNPPQSNPPPARPAADAGAAPTAARQRGIAVGDIVSGLVGAVQGLPATVGSAVAAVQRAPGNVKENLDDGVARVTELKDDVLATPTRVQQGVEANVKRVGELATAVVSAPANFKQSVDGAINSVQSVPGKVTATVDAVRSVPNKVEATVTAVTSVPRNVKRGVDGAVGRVTAVAQTATNITGNIQRGVAGVASAAGGLGQKVQHVLGDATKVAKELNYAEDKERSEEMKRLNDAVNEAAEAARAAEFERIKSEADSASEQSAAEDAAAPQPAAEGDSDAPEI